MKQYYAICTSDGFVLELADTKEKLVIKTLDLSIICNKDSKPARIKYYKSKLKEGN